MTAPAPELPPLTRKDVSRLDRLLLAAESAGSRIDYLGPTLDSQGRELELLDHEFELKNEPGDLRRSSLRIVASVTEHFVTLQSVLEAMSEGRCHIR